MTVPPRRPRSGALGREWDAAIAAKDLDRLMGFFAEDAQTLGDNAPPARGLAAIREAWGGLLSLPGLSFRTVDEVVEVAASADVGYTIGRHTLALDTPDGRIADEGKYLLAWKKVGGAWKLAADMSNSNLPAA